MRGGYVTRSLGKELGSRKIRLNSINSGMVEALLFKAVSEPASS
jgi:hypothetical protein